VTPRVLPATGARTARAAACLVLLAPLVMGSVCEGDGGSRPGVIEQAPIDPRCTPVGGPFPSGFDLLAGIRNIFGGDIPEYSKLISAARDHATAVMVEAAEAQGADAIVAVRYTTSMIAGGISEILVYGTAVKLA